MKRCITCGKEKALSEFHSHGYRRNKSKEVKLFKPDCKECANEKWRAQYNQRLNMFVKEWKCVRCGYDRCKRALEFHHIDRTEKDFVIAAQTTASIERLKREIEKCILVCANCHREIHDGG